MDDNQIVKPADVKQQEINGEGFGLVSSFDGVLVKGEECKSLQITYERTGLGNWYGGKRGGTHSLN